MRITNIHVDRFGIWDGLRIDDVSEKLTVVFGPNEAGKTTLLEYLRGVLYGFGDGARRSFMGLPGEFPSRAARLENGTGDMDTDCLWGGSLVVESDAGTHQIRRIVRGVVAAGEDGEKSDAEHIEILDAEGEPHPDDALTSLLAGVDKPTFNNVFAVELRELQQLATLNDTDAADHLYKLTSGLDRVSLIDVMRELGRARGRLLAPDGSGEIVALLQERERLLAQCRELAALGGQWRGLAARRTSLAEHIKELKQRLDKTQHSLETVEAAREVQSAWQQKAALDEQLAALSGIPDLPPRSAERMARLESARSKHRRRLVRLTRRQAALRQQWISAAVNEALWANGPRIRALAAQQSWLVATYAEVQQLERGVADLSDQHAQACRELGLPAAMETGAPAVMIIVGGKSAQDEVVLEEEDTSIERPDELDDNSAEEVDDSASLREVRALADFDLAPRTLSALRGRVKETKQAAKALAAARAEFRAAGTEASELRQQFDESLVRQGSPDLAEAVPEATRNVSQFERRITIDERIDQLTRRRSELEQQSRDLGERQVLSLPMMAVLFIPFALGVVLVLTGLVGGALFHLAAGIGWGMAIIGIAGTASAVAAKVVLERSAARRLAACSKQREEARQELEQAIQDRDALDLLLPLGSGPFDVRLQEARRQLAGLEAVLAMREKAKAAVQRRKAARLAGKRASEALKECRAGWRSALASAGLPETLSPRQLRNLVRHRPRLVESQRRLREAREALNHKRRQWMHIVHAVEQLAAESGVELSGPAPHDMKPNEKVQQLVAALDHEEQQTAKRRALAERRKRLRRAGRRSRQRVRLLGARRRQLLRQAGAETVEDFQRIAAQHEEARSLRTQRDELAQLITAVLSGRCDETEATKLLSSNDEAALSARRAELAAEVTESQDRVAQLHEHRGDLQRQMDDHARDRRLDVSRLELRNVEERLRRAVGRWQVLAATDYLLDAVRRHYETERQPQTLHDASAYLEKLTLGQHVRVWAPLGERSLRVDDSSGRSLPIDVLSRGTREAVLLALRLALAEDYARRGAELPLVWDDVLVNLDAQRVQAAVQLLKDFAAAGHQVLLLTCHDHIVKCFRSARVPVWQLPARGGEVEPTSEPGKKPRRTRRAPATTQALADQIKESARKPKTKRPRVNQATVTTDSPSLSSSNDDADAVPPGKAALSEESGQRDSRERRLDPPDDGTPPPPKKRRRTFTWQSPEFGADGDSHET